MNSKNHFLYSGGNIQCHSLVFNGWFLKRAFLRKSIPFDENWNAAIRVESSDDNFSNDPIEIISRFICAKPKVESLSLCMIFWRGQWYILPKRRFAVIKAVFAKQTIPLTSRRIILDYSRIFVNVRFRSCFKILFLVSSKKIISSGTLWGHAKITKLKKIKIKKSKFSSRKQNHFRSKKLFQRFKSDKIGAPIKIVIS